MEKEDLEKTRKRLFVYTCFAFTLPVLIAFTILDWVEGDVIEAELNVLTAVVFVVSLFAIRRLNADRMIYRAGVGLMAVVFLYNVYIGSGGGTAIYWLFGFPLAFVFLLGRREGTAAAAIFILVVALLLLDPLSLSFYTYSQGVSMRFLASLLFVTLMGYALESSREKYWNLFIGINQKLTMEKEHLESAMKQIKTMQGLIPICCHCKKIRNDEGFWEQVEVFVRDHSDANFSHGICPDCKKRFYAE